MNCLCCGRPEGRPLRVLKVRTLHVRGLDGDRRVQALGDFETFGICGDCLQARVARAGAPFTAVCRRAWPFLLVFIAGAALTWFLWDREWVLRMPGLAAIFCGVLGIGDAFVKAFRERDAFSSLSEGEARRRAALLLLAEKGPRKQGEEDLSWIPDDEAPEPRALMARWDLLPAIAKQAAERLRSGTEEKAEGQ